MEKAPLAEGIDPIEARQEYQRQRLQWRGHTSNLSAREKPYTSMEMGGHAFIHMPEVTDANEPDSTLDLDAIGSKKGFRWTIRAFVNVGCRSSKSTF